MIILANLLLLLFGLQVNGQTDLRYLAIGQRQPGDQLERESSWRQQAAASQLFNGRRLTEAEVARHMTRLQLQLQPPTVDHFRCAEPTRDLFQSFASNYNRTFENNLEELERKSQFFTSSRRIIMLNRIVQDASLDRSFSEREPEKGNYHFIAPLGASSAPLWYADITDCELGLIKYAIFNLFYHIENNQLAVAYKWALDNSRHLPLLSADGFEQLVDILLVRLHDRFVESQRINQLFQWPIYLKRLAGYVYHRRELLSRPADYQAAKLALVSFAYPAYYKDLKYNLMAANRTSDNLAAHEEHERFNRLHNRHFHDLRERNKRLVIFRQRWTLLQGLNSDATGSGGSNDWRSVSIRPQWQLRQPQRSRSERLMASDAQTGSNGPEVAGARFRATRFADLTDAEFVAYLNNDFSLLPADSAQESARYLEQNFGLRRLDAEFKGELAAELELRRSIQQVDSRLSSSSNNNKLSNQTLELAREVIEELIGDVGLPIGPAAATGIQETEYMSVFKRMVQVHGKSYALAAGNTEAGQLPSETEFADEARRRYEQFKFNYARFKAWSIKEGWFGLQESQLMSALRLADMSWPELKLSLFKICCLTEDNLRRLSSTNTTIHYLGSNQFLCQPMSQSERLELELPVSVQVNPANSTSSLDTDDAEEQTELGALELYYYYCLHFNKHHSDMDTFYSRFSVFRWNVDQIRRHSCTRGLTLYESLLSKRMDTLNQIDTLDPRRSYTDDLNLDRYRYFQVPNLESAPRPTSDDQTTSYFEGGQSYDSELGFDKLRDYQTLGDEQSAKLTAGFGRNSFFAPLLEPSAERRRRQQSASYKLRPLQSVAAAHNQTATGRRSTRVEYADRLVQLAGNRKLQAEKYRRNSANQLYQMVTQHYRDCLRGTGRDEAEAPRTLTCQPSGPLAEQSDEYTLSNQLTQAQMTELLTKDSCLWYKFGLESVKDGLIKQDETSVLAIKNAKCYNQ